MIDSSERKVWDAWDATTELREALGRPKWVAILKHKGHQKRNSLVAAGNAAARYGRKRTDRNKCSNDVKQSESIQKEQITPDRIKEMQDKAGAYEKSVSKHSKTQDGRIH